MNQSLPLNKLMILKMLDSVNFPLTNSQITEFLIKYNYATYFDIQQTFSDLCASSLILEEAVHHSTRYSITESGQQTLLYYKHLIPDIFIENLHEYLKEHKIELRNTISTVTGYTETSKGDYAVECRILEKETPIFDMMVCTPTAELAEKMCFNWKLKQEQIYAYIMSQLLGEEENTCEAPANRKD